MKQIITIISTLFLLSSIDTFAAEGELAAEKKRFAIGAIAGTSGIGISATFKINDYINMRALHGQLDISESFEEDDINYDGDFEVKMSGVMLDFYPFKGTFRLSAGYFKNGNDLTAVAEPGANGTVEIDDFEYDITGESLGAAVSWDGSAPYLGLGWGNAFGEGSNWTVTFDLGVLFSGAPYATLSASDGLFTQALNAGRDLNDDIAAEEASLNDDLNDYDIYPVVQLGLSYTF